MLRVHSILAAGLAAVSFSTVQAADDSVEQIVVTATRTPVPAAEVAVPVVIITREEIERSLAGDVGELLKQHAGVEIGRNGGPGQVASLFIRGTNNDHAVVLVDGVRVNPGTIGGAAIQHILPEAIERIEVVKSPRSSLYGSDALGGVVQIFTRAAARDRFAAMVSGGRYGTLNGQLDAGVAFGDRGGLGFTVGHVDSDGFPARDLAVTDSGYDNTTANVLAEMRASDAVTLRARAWHAQGTSEYFDFLLAPVSQDFENSAYAAEAELRPRDHIRARVNVSRVEDDLRQNDADDFVRTRRDAVDLQTDWRLPRGHELTAGALLQREETDSLSFGLAFDERTDVDMFFLQDRWSGGPHDVLVAGGFTDHETFGSETTWNAEYGVTLPSRTRLSFASGTAFHAPDATDRYGFGGNPGLDPERSRQVEVGLRQPIGGAHQLYVTAFQNDVDDLIVFRIIDPLTFEGRNENVEKARIRGVEGGYALNGASWSLRFEVWLHDPENRSTGERLLRRAREGASLTVQRRFARAELGVDVLASGERKDFGFPAQLTLDSYVLVGAGARFEITDAWSVQARVDNAFDEEYELANGFNTAGRSFTLATRYRFR